MNKYKKAYNAFTSIKLLKDDEVQTIEEVLKEKIEQETEWHREPKPGDDVLVLWSSGEIDNREYDVNLESRWKTYCVFSCKDGITKEQLEAAGVARMGLLERIAFTFAPDDWLTEEDRLNQHTMGHLVYFHLHDMKWHITFWNDITERKWYKHKETAEELCKWLNDNCDYAGRMKG